LPKVPVVSTISVIPTYTNAGKSCAGAALSFTVTVLPLITISPVNNEVVCSGSTIPALTPVHDAGIFPGSSVAYGWTVSGTGISLVNGSGTAVPAFTTLNPGSTDLVATITLTPKYTFGARTCDGTPVSYTITVKPSTPSASGGPDTSICAAATYTMQASATSGTSGLWTQLGANIVTITSPASGNTTITGLQTGNTYQFVWTVTGFASCPSTKDTVVITVTEPLINKIDTTTRNICSGQFVTITGQGPSGGNGTYIYQWQVSTDGISWGNIVGQTGANLTISPATSVYVRRVVTSLPCITFSEPAHILVQPPISNNVISATQAICINTIPSLIAGSTPAGANGAYTYLWQVSTDGGVTWTTIPGATSIDYQPGVLSASTRYRRLVQSGLCNGPQSNTSNVVIITVNPDAKALFTSTKDTSCAPFVLNPSIVVLQTFPLQNSSYDWYANNVFIGSGATFPGYTLVPAGSSVVIKLVANSPTGCKKDSMEHSFYTFVKPVPSFTVSDTVGCGPLTVLLNNTTPNTGNFIYQWSIGNAAPFSTLSQPGSITLQPNTTYGDSIYLIKLKVISICDTITVTKQVRVKSKPKAIFSPSQTIGCSPMTVIFTNSSLGLGNTYTWNFDDGSPVVTTTSNANVSHTFFTGVVDTFFIRLVAVNECGSDTLRFGVVVSPNAIHLVLTVNGNLQNGCAPHTVSFLNYSSGGASFSWNFGDGNFLNTTNNIDTVTHTYLLPGTYTATLFATNGCSDTSTTKSITVYPKPTAAFTQSAVVACKGETISFTNNSTGAGSYQWQFGDAGNSTLSAPTHIYTTAGTYTIKLTALSQNPQGGFCSDTAISTIQINNSQPGWFTASDTASNCAPLTVNFTNMNTPSVTATWDFGDGGTGTGNNITHTYTQAGTFTVTLVAVSPGGCTYTTVRTIKVLGPSGTLVYAGGYVCNNQPVSFQAIAANTNSFLWNFGDGNSITTTTNTVSHVYLNGGVYLPTVTLLNTGGCQVLLKGVDTIKVEKIKAGFTSVSQPFCGLPR
jgi:PKD repeat protein